MAQNIGENFMPFTYGSETTKREFIGERAAETNDRKEETLHQLFTECRHVHKIWKAFPDGIEQKFPDDAFMVVDIGDVLKKHEEWVEELPRVTPFFAVKCMPYTPLLSVLAALGAGFDCASLEEIDRVLSLGVSPSRIVYSHTRKQKSYLSYAARNNVDLMTFDDESELFKIKEIFPTARLLLRLSIFDRTAQNPFGFKYGCHHKSVKHVLETAKKQNMNVVGIHFHIGSGSQSPSLFESALQFVKKVFDVAKHVGFHMNIVDIGGGFPGSPRSNHPFRQFAYAIRQGIEDYFPAESGVTFIAEPGRFYVESAGTLVANIIGIKTGRLKDHTDRRASSALTLKRMSRPLMKRQSSTIQQRLSRGESISHFAEMSGIPSVDKPMIFDYMYFVNDGLFTSFLRNLFGFPVVPPLPLKEVEGDEAEYLAMIMGQSCPEEDVIVDDCWLPQMEVGDWLIFEDMGAYTCMPTGFNGFEKQYFYYAVPENAWPFIQPLLAACTAKTERIETRSNHNNNRKDECDSKRISGELLQSIYSLKEL